ncbi:hypothetical protein [Streptomyces sp. NPDC102462]|uniref:hypothetical protein n=1 Tax=Streptomyces sp. NPDC102462 TaxID=3366178 RepID=UPI00381CB36A
MRWLSGSRRRRCLRQDVADRLMEIFSEPRPLRPSATARGRDGARQAVPRSIPLDERR